MPVPKEIKSAQPREKKVVPILKEEPALPSTAVVQKEPSITDQDKEDFLKSVLGDQPFTKEIKLYGGSFKMVLKTLSVSENQEIFNQITTDRNKGLADSTDSYFVTLSLYRLALSLISIDDKTFTFEVGEDETKLEAGKKYFDKWNGHKLGAIIEAYNGFQDTVAYLATKASDQSFWKAAESRY